MAKEMVEIEEWKIIQLFEEAINDAYPPYLEFTNDPDKGVPPVEILRKFYPEQYDDMFRNYCLAEGIMIVDIDDGTKTRKYYEKRTY